MTVTGAKPYRALVADDDENVREFVASVLASNGIEATTVCDGQEAIDLFCAGAFDVVILDVDMPRMDGIGALEAIRSRQPDARVIVISGNPANAAKASAASAFVAKPFTSAELLSVLSKVLDALRPKKKAEARGSDNVIRARRPDVHPDRQG